LVKCQRMGSRLFDSRISGSLGFTPGSVTGTAPGNCSLNASLFNLAEPEATTLIDLRVLPSSYSIKV
jgi:hypothetical protein